MKKLNLIHVGTFGTPIGLKGEIKVNIFTSNFEVFKNLGKYYNFDGTIEWKFKKMFLNNNKLITHPEKCLNRNDTLLLRNKKIFSLKKYFVQPKSNEYFINDLIDCNVFLLNGKIVGKVIAIHNFGAGDLLEVTMNNKNFYIPMNNENLVSVELNKKKIIINPIKGIID